MTSIHIALAVGVLLVNGAAGLIGLWLWYSGVLTTWFNGLVRAGQGLLVAQVAWGGVLMALGREPASLHLLYGVLPLVLSFVAEQFRVASAQTVLDRRGLASAREMERLDDDEQRGIVLEIVRRETGVMAAACCVVTLLALRAADVSGGWVL